MNLVQGKTFKRLRDRVGGCNFSDTEFRRCSFQNCLASTDEIKQRPRLKRLLLVDCEESNSSLAEAIVEDVTVDGLRVRDLFIASDCAFKHVTFKGRIGSVKLTYGFAGLVKKQRNLQADLNEANSRFFSEVDWALDISQGEFEDLDISGIPLHLVRRDPETQVVLPGTVALSGAWREVPDFVRVWGGRIDALLKIGEGPELLLVAPKLHRDFKVELTALTSLRRAGLVA